MVTAELGPFDREGTRIDVDVSTLGEAESLQGAMLLPTPLRGLDGQVYAVAQGGVSLGGWSASGNQASVSKNHQTVGPDSRRGHRREVGAGHLHRAGGGAAVSHAQSAQQRFHHRPADQRRDQQGRIPGSAMVLDAGAVRVAVPQQCHRRGHCRVPRRDHAEGRDGRHARDRRHQRAHRHDRRRRERRHLVGGDLPGQPGGQGQGDRPGLAADRAVLRCRHDRGDSRDLAGRRGAERAT